MDFIISHAVGFMLGFFITFLYDNRSKLKRKKHRECSECKWNVMNGGTCHESKGICGQFISLSKGGE